MNSTMQQQPQDTRPAQRPRSKSTFSFRSNKSEETNNLSAKPKIDMKDAKRTEKKSRFGGKKTDPNSAVTELQPAMFAQLEKSTLETLKGHQYRDSLGNVIADPDKTNPTRPRLERPLDTIRSFEAAYDSSYKRRTQMIRAESADAINNMLPGGASRRSSMYLGNGPEPPFAQQSRYSPNHLHSQSQSRHMSLRGGYEPQYGYNPNNSYSGSNTPSGYPHRRPTTSSYRQSSHPFSQHRMSSDYSMYGPPQHTYHESESRDTVNTGESSGSASEGFTGSTDPSSENSSIDRVQPYKHMDSDNAHTYGRGSPIHNTAIREEEDGRSLAGGQHGYFDPYQPRRRSPPVAAPQQPPPERKVIKFETNPSIAQEYAAESAAKIAMAKPAASKRKSWFGRKK